jgi:hypothetical protein
MTNTEQAQRKGEPRTGGPGRLAARGAMVSALFLLPCATAVFAGEDPYAAAAEEAKVLWGDWSKTADTEKPYSKTAAADKRVLIWYPKGTSKSKLKKSSEKAVKAFDKLFADTQHVEGRVHRTAVLVPLAGPKSFASVTSHVGQKVPRLAGWASSAVRGTGFLLEEPLVAGWLVSVPGVEIWSPENELTNRLARLLTLERFGRQPQWLAQGLAWYVELSVCKDVYCFPFRTGFVSKKEHRSWPRKLEQLMDARPERAVELAELAGWKRNTWDETGAALSWGAVTMLASHYPDELPGVLAAFAAERLAQGRDVAEDGSWTWIADYEIPVERQGELLDEALGVDFGAELDRYVRKPKGYRRPR